MSVAARLAGFGALLGVVFLAALLLGDALNPDAAGKGEGGGAPSMAHGGAEAAHAPAAAPVRGLAVSDAGLTLEPRVRALRRARTTDFAFRILDSTGAPVRDFEIEHERRMHLILVRRDGEGFQHLHPRMGGDGEWSVPLTIRDPGSYRVFADFTTGGRTHTLAADLAVDGPAAYRELPQPAEQARTSDGRYDVRLAASGLHAGEEATLAFTVLRRGRPVRVEPYLGAGGHLVALREGDLAYLHTHPTGDGAGAGSSVEFGSAFPTAGAYRLFFQFKHDGRVHTAAFTREVQR